MSDSVDPKLVPTKTLASGVTDTFYDLMDVPANPLTA